MPYYETNIPNPGLVKPGDKEKGYIDVSSSDETAAEAMSQMEGNISAYAQNVNGPPNVGGYADILTTDNNAMPPAPPPSAAPDTKDLDEIFELEAKDPKHRMGNYLFVLRTEYMKLPSATTELPRFFSWVDGLTVMKFKSAILSSSAFSPFASKPLGWWNNFLTSFQAGVKYKKESQLWKYRIAIEGGLLKRRGNFDVKGKWHDTGKLEPYSTTAFSSHWSGAGWGIWVESASGNFFANRMKVNIFQHSSFLSGAAIRAGGEWRVSNGMLTRISGRSGHYKPSLGQLRQALLDLSAAGLAGFSTLEVEVFTKGCSAQSPPVPVKAPQFIAMTPVQIDKVFRPAPGM